MDGLNKELWTASKNENLTSLDKVKIQMQIDQNVNNIKSFEDQESNQLILLRKIDY